MLNVSGPVTGSGDRVELRLTAVAPEIADAARQPGHTYVLWLGTACARDQHLACAERAGVSRCRP